MLLLAVPTGSAAADWRSISDGVDGSRLSTDLARLHCKADICSAVERSLHPTPLPDGAIEVVDHVEYDCRQALTRTLTEQAFDAQARELAKHEEASGWSAVELGTLGYQAMLFACRQRSARLEAAEPASSQADAHVDVRPRLGLTTPLSRSQPSWTVQVFSSASAALSARALRTILHAHPQLTRFASHTEAAKVGGRRVYRIVFSGLPSPQAARTLCREAELRPSRCLVRPGVSKSDQAPKTVQRR
jgi:hypothetical protein